MLWRGFDAFIKKHGPSIQGVMCSRVNYYERKVQADTGYHEQPLTTLPLSNTITLPEADTSRCYSHKPNIRYPLPSEHYPRRREWLTRSILESQSATIFTYISQLNQGWNTSPASVPSSPCIYLNPQTKPLFSNSLSPNCNVSEFPYYCHITKAAFKYLRIYFESRVTWGSSPTFPCCPPVPQPRYLLTSSGVLQSWIFLAHTPNSITGKTYLESRSQQHGTEVLHVLSSWLVGTSPSCPNQAHTYIFKDTII